MATKQSFKLHSNGNFSAYLKRFSTIEKTLLAEIKGDSIVGKTHTPDKSVVKISAIKLTEIFDNITPDQVITDTKIGIFGVDNVIQTFKHIGDKDVNVDLLSEKVGQDEAATELKVYNKNLRFSFPGASPSLFKYIDAGLAVKIMDTSTKIEEFRVEKDMLNKIGSLCSIDSDNDMLTFSSTNGKIVIAGKTFEQELDITSTQDFSISIYKTHFGFVDKEDTEIAILESKIIFKSLESNTQIAIGKVD